MNTQGFQTLLRREWMQHHKGWLWLVLTPAALMLLGLSLGQVQVGQHDIALELLIFGAVAYALLSLTLALVVVAFQAPGLARRDVQDRSIEFWLSLPVGHGASLAATLLMHFAFFPVLALGAGLLGGMVLAPLVVLRGFGTAELAALPWGHALALMPLVALRLAVGLVLGLVWLAPFWLAMMAAAAWLKRWGAPVLGAIVGIGGLLLDKLYSFPWVLRGAAELLNRGAAAIYPGVRDMEGVNKEALFGADLGPAWAALGQDVAAMLGDLASPWLLLALGVGATSLALLWLRRARPA